MTKDLYEETNWDEIVKKATPAYKEYFKAEQEFLSQFVQTKSSILELGVGSARVLFELAKKAKKAVGIDYYQEQLKAIPDKVKSQKNIELFVMDARTLQFKERSFDLSYLCFNTLGNFNEEEQIQILKEMARVTTCEGNIALTVYNERAFSYQKEFYKNIDFDCHSEGNLTLAKRADGVKITSERFTKDKLNYLFEKTNIRGEITSLTDFVYGVRMKKQ